jgi:hypothetical protein
LFFFASAIAAGAIVFAVSAVIEGPYIGCACARASAGTPAARDDTHHQRGSHSRHGRPLYDARC